MKRSSYLRALNAEAAQLPYDYALEMNPSWSRARNMRWRLPWRSVDAGHTSRRTTITGARLPCELHEGARCFRELAEVVEEAVFVVRSDGKLLYANRRWRSLAALAPGGDFPGGVLAMIHPDDRQPWMIAWENALRTGGAYAIKPRVRLAADQEYVSQIEHVQPVRTAEGDVLEWVLVATMHESRDTHIEGLGRALVRKNEQLMAVAHEMRGPLAAIVGAVEVLEDRRNDPAYIARVRALLARQAGQLVRFVEDLIDVAQMEHGVVRVRKERVELRRVLEVAAETAQPVISACGQQLTTTTPMASAQVYGDEGRLQQIVVNLLINAAKFTERGGHIWLSLDRQGPSIQVRVRDTGIGIAREMLPRIFDPHVRIEAGAPIAGSGLGLGLALAQQLARLHDGDLTAHSEGVGRGSEFVLRLPAADPS